MATAVTSEHIGNLISFQSKNSKDEVLWRGTVKGIVDYSVAKGFGDIVSYHGAVKQADPDIDDVDELEYFLIVLDNTEKTLKVFANEWISSGSLDIVDERVTVTVLVYDISTNDHTLIKTILNANGYDKVKIESVVS